MLDVEFRDRALYVPAADALVCADLHLGRDATSAVQAPLGERRTLPKRLTALCDYFSPAEVVIAGDVLHSFSGTPGDAAESFDRIARAIEARDARLVVTPGNHDTMLAGVWNGRATPAYRLDVGTADRTTDDDGNCGDRSNDRINGGEPSTGSGTDDGGNRSGSGDGGTGHDDWISDGGVVVCHGHEPPETEAGTYVIGHDHPAIEIEGQRRPCYLYGPDVYEGADVLMVPALTELAAGVVINRMSARDFQSPLVADSGTLRPIVRDEDVDETLWFPPLSEFRSML